MPSSSASSPSLAGTLFGIVIYLIAFLPIHDKQNFAVRSLIITLALNLATVQMLLWAFGPQQKALPRVFGTGRFTALGMSIRVDQVVTIVATTLLLGSVLAWLRRSRKGLEIRAVMQNAEGAALCGISTRKTALPIMMLTGALAGLAAVLLSQNRVRQPDRGRHAADQRPDHRAARRARLGARLRWPARC